MGALEWTGESGAERRFLLRHGGEGIAGVLWSGDAAGCPLVLIGHGFTMHKRAVYPPSLAADLVARGFAVAAIDAPAHGERSAAGARDAESVGRAWLAHWRAHGASRIAAEHTALLDALASDAGVDAARLGYFGLSLATQYGLGVLAHEGRIAAAVLGLFGLPDPAPRISHYASRVACPVFFIQQRDDEIHPAERTSALFELIASRDKTLRASAGGHIEVPRAVFEEAYAWLAARLVA